MQRLNIPIGNTYCCSCDKQAQETNKHLFWQYKYIKAVKQGLETQTGITLIAGEMRGVLLTIKRKRCNDFKKQILAVTWGACTRKLGGLGIGKNLEEAL